MNNINDLRAELFATIRALRDDKNPMDIGRAKAVAEVAGRVIDSVKVETEFVRTFGGRNGVPVSGFISQSKSPPALSDQATQVGCEAGEPVPGRGLPPQAPVGAM